MSKNVNTGRSGKARVVGPINNTADKKDATSGKSVSNDHKRAGKIDKDLKKFLKVSTPVFNPGSGPTASQFTVNLTNQEAGVTYKYTTDGTSPTGAGASTLTSSSLSLSLTGTTNPSLTFKCYGYRNDYADSDIFSADYVLQSVADPIFASPSGSVPENQLISLNIEDGATGYYTLDGTTPSGGANTTSSQYTNAFVLSFGGNSSVTGKAIAVKDGSLDSEITAAVFNHDSNLDYGGPYDGIRDSIGKTVYFSPESTKIPWPSKVLLTTHSGDNVDRKVSFWGTDVLVQNNKPSTKNDFTSISAGQNHTLALTTSGTVVAWGDNSQNQITLSDNRLTTSGSITYIDAGDSHNLALTTGNDVVAWGDNSQGQTNVPSTLKAIRVAAGGEHSLALRLDRTVVGWGENTDGQLNQPLNLNDVIEISAGENHSAALVGYGTKTGKTLVRSGNKWSVENKSMPVGKAVCWGANDVNQSTVPSALGQGTPDLVKISCGGNHTLVLGVDGKVYGWGDNGHNQVPPAQGMSLNEIDGTAAFIVDISAGFSHGLALSDKGTVFAWGSNQNNQTNITNLLSNTALITAGDNYSLAYGLEPDENIYYNTGALDPSILYTGFIEVNSDTTIRAISQNKATQASSNLVSKSYTQQQLSGISKIGLLASKGSNTPIETGALNPARFTSDAKLVVKLNDDDTDKTPTVNVTVSHPNYQSYSSESTNIDDASEKRFSSTLVEGTVDKAYDENKGIDNYMSFNPGGYVGYKFDEPKRITKIDFATNADNFHKVGDGVIQGSDDGINWDDVAFFSKKFPDSYPPFLSLDGQALDRIVTLDMVSGGAGYTEDPVVLFQVASGQEGQDAKGKALFAGFSLTGVNVLNEGTGFTSVPTVSFTSVSGGSNAAGTAVLSTTSVVHGIELTHSGNGYTAAPTVSITGGGGQNAAATAYLTPTQITGIEIIENKVPYRTAPTTTLVGGGGTNAAAVAHLSSFVVGQINRSGILVGNVNEKPPFGYHLYDGVIVPGIGAPTLGSYSWGDEDPTGLYKLDHFDITNQGANYTNAPSVSLEDGLLTNTGQPYAVEFEVVRRGPVSGSAEAESSDFEVTNKDYLSGFFVNPRSNAVVSSGHAYWDANFATEMGTSWNNLGSPPTPTGTLGPLRYFFNHYNDHEFDKYHSIDTRLYHLKFHKDSALTQNIMITGGGGVGMSGYVELRNHNELLGFDDSDTLLDKLIALNTHPDYRNNRLDYDALDNNNISYEELLWSTPESKGGALPDKDATLIPYKLFITNPGQGYTGAPTITEEFDRSFPGMMYMLESGGIKLHENRPAPLPLTGQAHPEGYTLLWGSGDCNGNTNGSGPSGICSQALTGVYEEVWSNNSQVTGHYLKNKYLSTSSKFYRYYPIHFDQDCWDTHFPLQFEAYAPSVTGTAGVHTNDMNNANSAARLNFENKLAAHVNFTAIMPEHSDVNTFLASGSLDRVEVTNFGNGYTSTPTVTFTGGTTDVVATGVAQTSKSLSSVTITNGGSNYQAFPDITISGGGGAGAFCVGQKAASDITGLLLVSGGKNYTESPTVVISGGGATNDASAKCRLPVALGTLAFTNDKYYKEYRLVGQGDNALKNSQVNELEFYSGDYRISNYSNRYNHTLAIKSDTSLLGWGDNTYEQLPSSGISNATSVSAGKNHSLIAKKNGTVVAFGDNSFGQINVPDDLSNVINVSAGDNHSLALLAGGMVRAWGANISGQCDVPDSLQSGISGHNGAIAIKGGTNHSLALLGNGEVSAWGGSTPSNVPNNLNNVSSIAVGEHFSLALKDNGDVVGWGDGYGSQVPNDLKDVVAIDARGDHALALQVDGTVTGWGKIYDGESSVNFADTLPASGLNSGIDIFAGKNHGSILRSDGSMLTFGYVCTNELYNSGIIPASVSKTHCCGTTGSVIFDLGQTNSNKLNTNEDIAYRSLDISSKLSDNAYFPPDSGTLDNSVRIVAGVEKAGYSNSELVTGDYPLLQLNPTVSPETNANYGPSITVPIWDQDSVAPLEVRYTLDGTDPANGAGTIYEVTLPPNSGDFIYTLSTGDFTNSTTLKVFASSDVYLNSDIVSYTRQQLSAPTVTITQNGNSLDISMSVSMPAGESRTPSIYYTLDGSTPDETDYNYTSPISLQGSTATVKAKAFLVGYIDSNITTETYP